MKKSNRVSAGLLMFRRTTGRLEVFIAHPGGPFFAHRDEGHWTIPKGEIAEGEELGIETRDSSDGYLPASATVATGTSCVTVSPSCVGLKNSGAPSPK